MIIGAKKGMGNKTTKNMIKFPLLKDSELESGIRHFENKYRRYDKIDYFSTQLYTELLGDTHFLDKESIKTIGGISAKARKESHLYKTKAETYKIELDIRNISRVSRLPLWQRLMWALRNHNKNEK